MGVSYARGAVAHAALEAHLPLLCMAITMCISQSLMCIANAGVDARIASLPLPFHTPWLRTTACVRIGHLCLA